MLQLAEINVSTSGNFKIFYTCKSLSGQLQMYSNPSLQACERGPEAAARWRSWIIRTSKFFQLFTLFARALLLPIESQHTKWKEEDENENSIQIRLRHLLHTLNPSENVF